MLNPRYVENLIATAIAERDHYSVVKQKLVFEEGKIKCLPRSKATPDSFFISQITEQQLIEGFAVFEWQKLTAKAMIIMEELKI